MPPLRRIDVVLDSVKRLQRIGATGNLLNLLQKQHPADLAEVLGQLQDSERRTVFNTLIAHNSRLGMEALSELEPEVAESLLVDHAPDELARLFTELPTDDAAALVGQLPKELSFAVLELMHGWRQSPLRGFLGGRIDLIPHQLYIAREVSQRLAPRVHGRPRRLLGSGTSVRQRPGPSGPAEPV